MKFSRRKFIESAAVTSAAIAAAPAALAQSGNPASVATGGKTMIVCKYTGIQSIEAHTTDAARRRHARRGNLVLKGRKMIRPTTP